MNKYLVTGTYDSGRKKQTSILLIYADDENLARIKYLDFVEETEVTFEKGAIRKLNFPIDERTLTDILDKYAPNFEVLFPKEVIKRLAFPIDERTLIGILDNYAPDFEDVVK